MADEKQSQELSEFPTVAFIFPLADRPRGNYWWHTLEALADLLPSVAMVLGATSNFSDSYIPDNIKHKIDICVIPGSKFISIPIMSQGAYKFGIQLPPFCPFVRQLIKMKPQVLFLSGFSLWTFIAVALKPLMKWRLVVMYEGSSPSVARTYNRLIVLWRRMISSRVDAAITNTQAGKKYLCEWLSIDTKKIFVHPYEVPSVQVYPDIQTGGNTLIFATVGQLIPRKGIAHLIDAVHLLSQRRPDKSFEVWIIGDGPLREASKSKVRCLGLESRVRFLGWIDNTDLPEYLRRADVFIFPTLEDIWGVAPLEAMALGKPVICSKFAGAAELVSNGEDGWICDPYNKDELANIMARFLDDASLIHEMGHKAWSKMQSYTPQRAGEFLMNVALLVWKGSNGVP